MRYSVVTVAIPANATDVQIQTAINNAVPAASSLISVAWDGGRLIIVFL